MKAITTLLTLSLSTLALACTGGDSLDCDESGKCDTPDGLALKKQCENARTSAMDERRPHFTPLGVRWSCKDVSGVTADSNTEDDRGQEYCEYFTMLHTDGIPEIVMNEQGPVFCDASTPCATGTCNTEIFSCVTGSSVNTNTPAAILGKNLDSGSNKVTPLDPRLSTGQLEWMAQNPTQKVGECVFTSWHQDIDRPLKGTDKIGGYGLTARASNGEPLFRMGGSVNSNGAAQALLNDCLAAGKKPKNDGFLRGCNLCGVLAKDGLCVPWRKSDPSVCTMAMRVAECGCSVNVKDEAGASRKLDLAKEADLEVARELFVPHSRRGFTLGTWDGVERLPAGCRYVSTGDAKTVTVNGVTAPDPVADQTLVACDLLASHLSAATAKDPKEACRQAFGDEVVVHVRAPMAELATLSCDTSKPHCQGAVWDLENL
ncbi:MAG: hypothetical protein KF773_42950 [Deltaproteobacteria bacterium]|nr:hypothetical protein [Deltaproteobacteria bacterium]MCW5808410.1 hypothetical protein [Deltaproteobacteria bacterium]